MPRKPTKAQLNANIWKFYLFQIFGAGLGLVIPVIVLFWQENGLNLTEIMILQSLFSLILIVLEVPSGFLADIIGRKRTFIWATSFYTISIIIYFLGHNFATFLLAESFIALGFSLLSGADSAFVYDTLKDLKREQEYKKIWGRKVFYALSAMAALNLAGGYIGSINTRYTWAFALIPTILMFVMSFTFVEPNRSRPIFKRGYLISLLEIIQKNVLKKSKVKWIIIYAAVVFSFFHGAFWFYQPIFELTGVKVVYYGVVFAGFNIFAAIVSRHAHQIEEYFGQRKMLILLTVFTGLGSLLMSQFLFLFTFLFIAFHQFVRAIYNVIISDYLNQLTDSSVRATVLSVQNLFARLLYAILIPLFGLYADIYSVPQTLAMMGITVFFAGGGVLFLLHRYRVV